MKNLLYLLVLIQAVAYAQIDTSHHVPENKVLGPAWVSSLYHNSRTPFSGEQLKTIGMPCGGIAAGQLYVRGDGTLAGWWIANNAYNTGYGAAALMDFNTALGPWKVCYQTFTPVSYIKQGFTIKIGGITRELNAQGFKDIEFTGEYPVADIAYKDKIKPMAVKASLRVYSPFIPLDERSSATPGTILTFTLRNTSKFRQTVILSGYLQNPVGLDGKDEYTGTSRNRIVSAGGLTSLEMDLLKSDLPAAHPWNGNVALSLLSDHSFGQAENGSTSHESEKPLGTPLVGNVGTTVNLMPGESRQITFLITWYFPNRPEYANVDWNKPLSVTGDIIGNNYANWYSSSQDVAKWLKENFNRLHDETMSFHDAYYSTTLPYWLTRRILMPVSNLATETCQWWSTGKFWAWEGVGSCVGTCTHVWNYEQGMAHLFPGLERNVREQTDLSVSFNPDGGINTRDGGDGVAVDGQAGTILKAYREHLLNKDNDFLVRNWQQIKKATQFLIRMDGNGDGLIEGKQPNTYDISFYGANTYVGGLYLASLKAAGKMANFMNDRTFADSCNLIATTGSLNSAKKLYNGQYFIQDVDLKIHPDTQYGTGCLSDQLFGQTWAHLVGLGYIYPENEVRSALRSIWKFNWAPDIATQTKYHKPERKYADPGEAGLFNCTWPNTAHPGDKGVRYRDEVWTGVEYQVATNMIYEGMIDEGLSVVKGVDMRYQPEKHNPWNEIECGDHYARAMASWGVLLALEDYSFDGPNKTLGFSPKINASHFKGFFSAAEGWGTIAQHRSDRVQTDAINLYYGRLMLKSLVVAAENHRIRSLCLKVAGKTVPCRYSIERNKLLLSFPCTVLDKNKTLSLHIIYEG